MGAFLMAIAGPLARQVLISLGFAMVTYVCVDTAVNSLLSQARAAWTGAFLGDAAQLIAMAGVNTALSILAGAIAARVTMITLKKLTPST